MPDISEKFFLCHPFLAIYASNLYYRPTRNITPKSVTSGGAHARGLAPEHQNPEETRQRWRAVGNTVSDLTGPESNPRPIAPTTTSISAALCNLFSRGHRNGVISN